ncbi:MAG TPA: cytochrome P460 family protein [Thermoanaerobaculia bacterium]|nr:cytochrome P460 family protein [Thermoanaerobaculia bacterium]
MGQLSRFRASRVLGLAFLAGSLAVQGEPQALNRSSTLRAYASWPEVTKEPYRVPAEDWTLCMAPTLMGHPGRPIPPNVGLFIRVYANPQAHPLMRSSPGPKFPVGSVIAKAKMVEGNPRPVAVAFMVKHEAGYDPEALDWEFLFFEGDPLRKAKMDLGLVGCGGCHGRKTEGDGVFADYLRERKDERPTEGD